jgi:PAS domain S-box-containing protein
MPGRQHRELLEREQRLRAIYDGTYEYIGVLAPDGTLLEANRASLEFAPGTTREDVIGRPFWETVWFVHTPGAPEKLREAIARAAAGETFRVEWTLRRPSGDEVVFDFSLRPVRDEHGDVVLIVPEGRDITENKRVKRAAQHQRSATACCSSGPATGSGWPTRTAGSSTPTRPRAGCWATPATSTCG